MTSLLQSWERITAQEHADFAGSERYLLIDASQLPINAAPWSRLVADGEVANLLAGQPEASHPEVCALLCEYAAQPVDSLLKHQLARRPFAFIALASVYALTDLAAMLSLRTRVTLPDDRDGLLRFYDAAVFQTLAGALSAHRWQALLSPCVSWTYVRRDGSIGVERHPRRRERIFYPRVEAGEFAALQGGNRVDAVLSELRRHGRLAGNADPFEVYRQMQALLAMLDAQTPGDRAVVERLAYRLAAILSLYPGLTVDDASIADAIGQAIALHRDDHDALCEAVHDAVADCHERIATQGADTEIQE
ncbi:DUF4123 domain-containing protein [Paraburkholderia bannensis]|uniref:DUF4123 domain-containing protein n=1 Tax=Paraburkholderia bannensis TaxID=765414 RepID=UPI002AB2422D|nr:DUF4123 domain-containing protein [Paraburkholderia bannensis]